MFHNFGSKEVRGVNKLNRGGIDSTMKDVWDWEKESKIWEACEDMERWATGFQRKQSTFC